MCREERFQRDNLTLVANNPSPEVQLTPLNGEARPLVDWLVTFHMAAVVLDPFTNQSAWLLDTTQRILGNFAQSNVRPAFIVTGSADDARQFLGPIADEFIVFVDEDRAFVKSAGLEQLPAFLHLNNSATVLASAQGWDPDEWRVAVDELAEAMSWIAPLIPDAGDPMAFNGSPALG